MPAISPSQSTRRGTLPEAGKSEHTDPSGSIGPPSIPQWRSTDRLVESNFSTIVACRRTRLCICIYRLSPMQESDVHLNILLYMLRPFDEIPVILRTRVSKWFLKVKKSLCCFSKIIGNKFCMISHHVFTISNIFSVFCMQ